MSAQDKLQDICQSAEGRVEQLVTLALESEVDHRAGEALRLEIKKWIDSIKPDSLIHISLHMIGFGEKWVRDKRDQLAKAGDDLNDEQRSRLQLLCDEAAQRVQTVAKLSLAAERDQATSTMLKEEVQKWIESVDSSVLEHFSTHMIGTGVVFASYVRNKVNEIPAAQM